MSANVFVVFLLVFATASILLLFSSTQVLFRLMVSSNLYMLIRIRQLKKRFIPNISLIMKEKRSIVVWPEKIRYSR